MQHSHVTVWSAAPTARVVKDGQAGSLANATRSNLTVPRSKLLFQSGVRHLSCRNTKRRFARAMWQQPSEADRVPDPMAQPFFSDAFKEALQGALERQGKDALVSGEPAPERPSAHEEILLGALQQSRRNLLVMKKMRDDLEAAIKREETQFERMHFAMQKAQRDVAYIKTLESMLEEARQKSFKAA